MARSGIAKMRRFENRNRNTCAWPTGYRRRFYRLLVAKVGKLPVAQSGTSVTSSIIQWISTAFLGLFTHFSLVTPLVPVLPVIAPAETGVL